jgi:DNA-binding XRE family transcriptional regulator
MADNNKKRKKNAADDLVDSLIDEINTSHVNSDDSLLGLGDSDTKALRSGILGGMGGDDIGTSDENPFMSSGESNYQDERELPEGLASRDEVLRSSPVVPITMAQEKPNLKGEATLIADSNSAPKAQVYNQEQKTAILGDQAPQSHHQHDEGGASPFEATLVVVKDSPRAAAKEKISYGTSPSRGRNEQIALSATEAQLVQAENLKISQTRIIELEKENEKLREENELLASAADLSREKIDELFRKSESQDRSKKDLLEAKQNEINLYKEAVNDKDRIIAKFRNKSEELEARLKSDLKKIRVRERELENRLELLRMEKNALTKSKDESLMEFKRKIDHLTSENETFRRRIQDANQKLENNNEQLARTVRALRLTLTHLEVKDEDDELTIVPIKKAE